MVMESLNPAVKAPRGGATLSKGALGTADITFMVIAVAAPMAIVVATMPLAFGFGNGAGVVGTFLLAAVAMALFAVGYVRLIPHVTNAGAFYAILASALNAEIGLAAAYTALFSYVALCCSTLAALTFFAADLVKRLTGYSIDWSIIGYLVILTLGLLSYFRITLTAKILAVALMAEVISILLLDCFVVGQVDVAPLAFEPFAPSTIFVPGLGVSAIYAFNSCLGLESTAIYQEEARDREKSVPRATFIAIAIVGIFYVFSAWCLTASTGAAQIKAVAAADPGHFVFNATRKYMGPLAEDGLAILVVTSAFAATLGLFNNGSRYLFALARDGVVPRQFAWTHPVYKAPAAASAPILAFMAVVVAVSRFADLDPLLTITTSAAGIGSVGLMALLAITACAVPVYFIRRRQASFATVVPPIAGGLMIATGVYLSLDNYALLTGSSSTFINGLPWSLLVVAAIGGVQAFWLRSTSIEAYRRIGTHQIPTD